MYLGNSGIRELSPRPGRTRPRAPAPPGESAPGARAPSGSGDKSGHSPAVLNARPVRIPYSAALSMGAAILPALRRR